MLSEILKHTPSWVFVLFFALLTLGYFQSKGRTVGRRKVSMLPVAIELKVGRFEPEHLGKLEFYLEALDRDIKKPHERPAIGVLLCASNDAEVVEYALSRSLSPALIAEYQTLLPDKKLLQIKLHEFYQMAEDAASSVETLNQDDETR